MLSIEEMKSQMAEINDLNGFFLACGVDSNDHSDCWLFATDPLEQSLDLWMKRLAESDKKQAIQVAAIFARHAFSHVLLHHKDQAREIGFALLKSDPCADGEPIEKQLINIENWLQNPNPKTWQAVKKGIDPSRQLEIWEEDLLPPDDQMWLWIIENIHLLSLAMIAPDDETQDDDPDSMPYDWSYKACVSRSAVCSLKVIAGVARDATGDLVFLFKKAAKEW